MGGVVCEGRSVCGGGIACEVRSVCEGVVVVETGRYSLA